MHKTWGALFLISSALIACGDSNKATVDAPSGGGDTGPMQCATDMTMPKVNLGAIVSMTMDPSATLFAEAKPQFDLVASQINDNCGILGGAAGGAAVAFTVMDDEGMPAIAKTNVMAMIAMPVAGIVAVHGTASEVVTAPVAVSSHVPEFIATANADSLTGCPP